MAAQAGRYIMSSCVMWSQNPWGNRGIRLSPGLPGEGENQLQSKKEVPNFGRQEGHRLLVRGFMSMITFSKSREQISCLLREQGCSSIWYYPVEAGCRKHKDCAWTGYDWFKIVRYLEKTKYRTILETYEGKSKISWTIPSLRCLRILL